jgi:hypothetical protein
MVFVSALAIWLLALFAFYMAFRGIVLKQVNASAPLPWYFFPTDRSLYGAQATGVGCLYLVAGLVALYSAWYGVAALLATMVIAWAYGLSRPTM